MFLKEESIENYSGINLDLRRCIPSLKKGYWEELNARIKKYAEGSKPKIGWDGINDLNHFELIEKIYSNDFRFRKICAELINQDNLDQVIELLHREFSRFYSAERLFLLKECVAYRFGRLIQVSNS